MAVLRRWHCVRSALAGTSCRHRAPCNAMYLDVRLCGIHVSRIASLPRASRNESKQPLLILYSPRRHSASPLHALCSAEAPLRQLAWCTPSSSISFPLRALCSAASRPEPRSYRIRSSCTCSLCYALLYAVRNVLVPHLPHRSRIQASRKWPPSCQRDRRVDTYMQKHHIFRPPAGAGGTLPCYWSGVTESLLRMPLTTPPQTCARLCRRRGGFLKSFVMKNFHDMSKYGPRVAAKHHIPPTE
jgi:hypothetical protein